FHVSVRTANGQPFDGALERVWQYCQEGFSYVRQKYHFELVAFVLMNNHYHLILSIEPKLLKKFTILFNLNLNLRISPEENLFQQTYHQQRICSFSFFGNCYRYVYQNPVRAQLCQRAELYRFSTLFHLVEHIPFCIPIHDRFGFKDPYNLGWLNSPQIEFRV
ncbi:MAG: hypothetical protein HOM21_03605, partial [Halobacteriovoraceae bacterium]|nr:hypothetical protein [Halobacteriovoraceae bacterium]